MVVSLLVLNDLLRDEKYKPLLSVVKGFRNGAVYGAKVRLPHALVTTFLFRSGTIKELLIAILKATYTHSKNLAIFVTIYKSLLIIFKRYGILPSDKYQLQPFLAGFIAGLTFGKENKINEQINLYLLARVVYGLTKLAASKRHLPMPNSKFNFSIFAALVWGLAVWLFEAHQKVLQPSLQASMTYLYRDSNHWRSLKDFLFSNTS